MFIIANNITTRNAKINRIFQQLKASGWDPGHQSARELGELARQCAATEADLLEINTQQHHDRPEAMEFAVKVIQQATNRQLCLSTNNAEALEAGLKVCKRPPLVNYVSIDESKLRDMIPIITRYGAKADVILLVSDPAAPTDAREMLHKAAILIGVARDMGVSNDHIFIDPGLIHVTSEIGQHHLNEIREFLQTLPGTFEPPVRSTCWIANASAGAPRRLRAVIEMTLLPMLAGLGLSSVFLDVLRRENMRTVNLIKVFNNEKIYSQWDVES
ncbi:MAG: dihydropteroate synthase [Dehalococcoidales bacterium]|nr:dihydropteroate synthase [Dehalococcoidales bacterium]